MGVQVSLSASGSFSCARTSIDFYYDHCREELVDIVHELHARNIHHGGLYKENILYRQRLEPDGATASIEAPLDGKHIEPVLINFGNASLEFECDAMKTNQRIQLCVEEPQAKDLIGCQQLLRFARSISAWYPCETISSDISHTVTHDATC